MELSLTLLRPEVLYIHDCNEDFIYTIENKRKIPSSYSHSLLQFIYLSSTIIILFYNNWYTLEILDIFCLLIWGKGNLVCLLRECKPTYYGCCTTWAICILIWFRSCLVGTKERKINKEKKGNSLWVFNCLIQTKMGIKFLMIFFLSFGWKKWRWLLLLFLIYYYYHRRYV